MRKILNELGSLPSSRLFILSELIEQFSRSVQTLAVDKKKREEYEKEKERAGLRKSEKHRLQKMKLQRKIMVRYLKGQSFEQIGGVFNYHPKTIYKMIKKYQHDLSVLHQIDYDIEKKKITDAERMIKSGKSKKQIIRELHISAHSVVAVAQMKNLELHP
tara:strand:+ start:1108 stop:1587 length:480 start_codon:yes stop_codon:yes gene_type:complete